MVARCGGIGSSKIIAFAEDARGCTVQKVSATDCRVIWRGDYQINGVAQLPVRAVSRRIVMHVAARCKGAASLAVQQLECQNDAVTKYTPIGERFCM